MTAPLVLRHQFAASLGTENAFGLFGAPSEGAVSKPARACWQRGGTERGGQRDESLVRESWWVFGVLDDNKLVAEIGERHLVSCGSSSSAARVEDGRWHG